MDGLQQIQDQMSAHPPGSDQVDQVEEKLRGPGVALFRQTVRAFDRFKEIPMILFPGENELLLQFRTVALKNADEPENYNADEPENYKPKSHDVGVYSTVYSSSSDPRHPSHRTSSVLMTDHDPEVLADALMNSLGKVLGDKIGRFFSHWTVDEPPGVDTFSLITLSANPRLTTIGDDAFSGEAASNAPDSLVATREKCQRIYSQLSNIGAEVRGQKN